MYKTLGMVHMRSIDYGMNAPKGLASYLDTVEGEEVDSSSVFERFD